MNKKLRSKYDKCLFKSIDIKNLLLYNVFPKLKTHLSNELIFLWWKYVKSSKKQQFKNIKTTSKSIFCAE